MPGQGLDSGRLWPYLRAIGQEVELCRRDLQEIEEEEDELAKAYIAEVLKTRDRQHEESWTKYMDLLEVLRKSNCKRIRLETLEAKHLDPVLRSWQATSRALSPNLPQMDGRAIYGIGPITTERAEMYVSPPPKKHTTVLAPSASTRSCVPKQSAKRSATTSSATRRSAPPVTTSTPPLVYHVDGHQRGVDTAYPGEPAAGATPDSRCQEPTLVQREPLSIDRTLGRQSRTQHLHSRDRGFVKSAVEELKEGVLEPIEHLFCVVILRAFVPSTMSLGTTMEEAYDRFVAMPPCRARDGHMQQAHSAAKRYAAALHHEGFKVVKDLLPLSRREALFARANLPKELIATCKDVVRELEAHTSITLLTKPRTYSKYKNVGDIKVLLQQLAGTGWWTKCRKRGPKGEPARPRELDNSQSHSFADVAPQEHRVIEPEAKHAERPHADVEKVEGDVNPKCWTVDSDLPLADALTALNRREEAWGTIDGPLERFLVVADFYVISHAPSSERGSQALEAFMAALQREESAVSRRALVLRRFQRCVVEVCPYAMQLAAQGVKTVRDLHGVDLVSWGLDPSLVTQIESMLAKMVAKHLYAEATGKGPEFEARYMAESFDPRFQRSATDPYGRAPRLESVRVKLHRPKDEHVESEEADPDYVPLPDGLWSSSSQNQDLQSDTELLKDVDKRPGPALPVKTVEEIDAESQRDVSEMTISSHHEHPHDECRRRRRQAMRRDLCRYAGCGQRFSHLDSLRLHERTHVDFPEYHRLKLSPELYRDSAFEACVPAYLPPYTIRTELETLRRVGYEWRRLDTAMKSKDNHRG